MEPAEENEKRVTLRDVADAAGISKAAASMALRDTGTVSAATRKRVKRIAEEMKYSPDALLSTIAGSRLRRRSAAGRPEVAVLRLESSGLGHSFIESGRDTAELMGLAVTDEPFTDPERELPSRLRQLYHRGVLGLVLHRWLARDCRELPDELLAPFAILAIEDESLEPRFHVIRRSDGVDFRRLFWRAASLGYRRPGIIVQAHPDRRASNDFVRLGMAELETGREGVFQSTTGTPPPPPLVLDFTRDGDDVSLIDTWLRRHQPDCVLTTTRWIKDKLDRMGYRGGFACEVLGDATADRSISGFLRHQKDVAEVALRQMDTLIRGRSFGVPSAPTVVSVRREWNEGLTLPPVEAD